MIGQIITSDKDGKPLDHNGNLLSLAVSEYQPSDEVKKLFARVQQDYQVAYALQHRPFREFDGRSLLDRTRVDQELFGAFVGLEWVPKHKKWRWKGRKNTARNKLIAILSRALAGMLYPTVHARNAEDEEDKMTARVMQMLIQNHLQKAGYEMKFLYFVLTALVNPAVFVEVEYVEKIQFVKQRLADGSVKIIEAVDELLSGLQLNSVPIDELLLSDFYSGTGQLQTLPYILRVRRIPWDYARGVYGDNPNFKYVQAGKTRVVLTGQENQTLYDIEWTEADKNYVQEITAFYRSEDLEVCWVGGVFMGNEEDPYNTNPFEHRRMIPHEGSWISIPVYRWVMSGFEPLDPTGRFAYFKSAAFKEYWDDATLNQMTRLAMDGTYLDVIKPVFVPGTVKTDSVVMAPGAVVGMPPGGTPSMFGLGPNLAAAYQAITKQSADMDESTQSSPVPGTPTPGVAATQTAAAVQQAKVFFGAFALMIGNMVQDLGALTMDCAIQYSTVGELDNTLPEALKMNFKTFLLKGKDKGKSVTNKLIFTDKHMGREYTPQEKENYEYGLYDKTGGEKSDQRIYEINPYQFARMVYTMHVDADQIVAKSLGTDRQDKDNAFNHLTDPRVLPFTDPEAVANDFVIEEYGGDDPEKYKRKGPPAGASPLPPTAGPGGEGAGAPISPPGGAPALAGV